MRISDLLRNKGAGVATTGPDATVAALVGALAAHNVGALVVLDAGRVVGIVSERDVVRHLGRRGAAVLDAPVADIMTTGVVTCRPGDAVDSLAATMTDLRVRHMPVVEDDRLLGIVSIGDIVKSRISELETQSEALESYITGG